MNDNDFNVEFLNGESTGTVTLLSGEDIGVKYTYGKVSFDGDDDNAMLNFVYDIVEGEPVDIKRFEKHIGDVLIYLIETHLKLGSLQYTNGVE